MSDQAPDDVGEPEDADDETAQVPLELVELHEAFEWKRAVDAAEGDG